MSIEEIARNSIKLYPETNQFFERKDKKQEKKEEEKEKEPIMNLLHTFQSHLKLFGGVFEDHEFKDADYLKGKDQNDITVNFILAVKHLNNKKIDSHLYFFRGFCEYLNPSNCMCIDIGTEPQYQSIN